MLKARYLYCFILLLQEKHISLHRYIIGLFPPTNYDFPSVYMAEVFLLVFYYLCIYSKLHLSGTLAVEYTTPQNLTSAST